LTPFALPANVCAMNKCVTYFRVSTDKQGINGLGMDAQRAAVERFLGTGQWLLLGEFSEVETGKRKDRPELLKALAMCRASNATLIIAKLDRLARNVCFLMGLRDSGVEFIAADMPQANRLTVGILAVVAEHELTMISQRTKEGLAAAKARGTKLGNPSPARSLAAAFAERQRNISAFKAQILPVIAEIQAAKITSLRGIARCLNARGFGTIYGNVFSAQTVKDLLKPATVVP